MILTPMKINGESVMVRDLGPTHGMWDKIHVYKSVEGRMRPVSEHTIPRNFLMNGGKCRTGGCVYECKPNP